jgi:flagellar biogenesis protein FliO
MGDEYFLLIGTVLACLFLVVAVLYAQPAIRRLGEKSKHWLPIKVPGRVRLNRTTELFIVEVDGNRLLVGSSGSQVSKLATLSQPSSDNANSETN